MDKITIHGGRRLAGSIDASGSKNAAVVIMAATILADGVVTLRNIPRITDTQVMMDILDKLGAKTKWIEHNAVEIDSRTVLWLEAPYELVRKMRASFHVLGPLLARFGKARVPAPGGCNIGARPVNFHIDGLKKMGADIHLEHGIFTAEADKLKGADIYFDLQSPGATEHIMAAATLAEGVTVIQNCAIEPEVVDLANFLKALGADIEGAGTTTITIRGVERLHGADYKVIPDRIESGTFAIAAAISKGDVTINGVVLEHLRPCINKLREAGITVTETENSIRIQADGPAKGVDIKTMAYPGFPTDLQQPFASLLSIAEGPSVIHETIYESRFGYVNELNRMGAEIRVDGRTTVINGVSRLMGANVSATDLRAGAAMLCAGLAAEGETVIENIEHIDRGYENVVERLRSLGADIWRDSEERIGEVLACSA